MSIEAFSSGLRWKTFRECFEGSPGTAGTAGTAGRGHGVLRAMKLELMEAVLRASRAIYMASRAARAHRVR